MWVGVCHPRRQAWMATLGSPPFSIRVVGKEERWGEEIREGGGEEEVEEEGRRGEREERRRSKIKRKRNRREQKRERKRKRKRKGREEKTRGKTHIDGKRRAAKRGRKS